jgi:hypothetical protein
VSIAALEQDLTDEFPDPSVLRAHIFKIRAVIGKGAVESTWGHGYALTPVGLQKVNQALGDLAESRGKGAA